MSRYFAFLFVEDAAVSRLLTSAIYVLNPRAKWPAHVTVSGPYNSLRNVPRKLEYQRRVLVTGAGHFRSEQQNTVYLRVGTFDLREISNKSDYEYNPHITLYDGLDHDLGDSLYSKLGSMFPFMKFDVSKLEIVATGAKQANFNLILDHIDQDFFRKAGVGVNEAPLLNNDQKVALAVRAVNEAILVSKLTY